MTEKHLVGIIRVPLSAFTYRPGIGREESRAITKRLANVFRKTPCQSHQWENHVKGLIDRPTLEAILATLHCTTEQLRATIPRREFPRVRLNGQILCLDGRHRLAAAKRAFGKGVWWPVKLYYAAPGRLKTPPPPLRRRAPKSCWY